MTIDRNKNRPGYKETKVGWVPDKWREKKLGSVFSERKETGHQSLELLAITGKRGVIPAVEIDRKDSSSEDKSKYKRIAPGDIGYNTMRMWQGVSAVSALEGIVSPAYTICTPKETQYPRFLGYLFKLHEVIYHFWTHSQGMVSDTLNLKYPNFAQIKLPLPPLEEQQAIAEVLGCWDEGLEQIEKLIDEKKLLKKGLMQRLLNGQSRLAGFSKDWKTIQLRDALRRTEPYEILKAEKSYPLISIKRHAKGIFSRGIIPRSKISYDKLAQVKLNDFLISKRQVSHGAYALVSEEHVGCYVSSEYVILESINGCLHMPYLKWLSKLPILWHKGYVSSNGVHLEKLILDPKHYLKHLITIPPTLDEQEAIAAVLETADEEIRLLEAERDALSEQKKGLMQKLLTGKVRLPAFRR